MTIDMTQNRVPYGLLTEEEKAALHEHQKAGGAFVVTWCSSWDAVANPDWCLSSVYRTVPLPLTQDEIAWDRLPDWAEWVARNQTGSSWAYEEEPRKLSIMWDMESGSFRRIDDFPGIILKRGTCDWKDSKQRRPK